MSLSPEEYREHLAMTAVRAGFSFGEVVLPQSHEFHLGRMRFHYLDWGNKHLPTIVFLHGGALTAHTWDLVSLALRDDYHCVALEAGGRVLLVRMKGRQEDAVPKGYLAHRGLANRALRDAIGFRRAPKPLPHDRVHAPGA